jgi:ABC-type Na+ efflux pump permease subunit
MRGLLQKIRYEIQWSVVWFSLGLMLVMGLLTALLPKVLGNIHEVFDRLPLIKPLITALLGVDPGDQISSGLSQAFLWTHPTVLSLIWAHELMYCSRIPAAEVDRGTADFLLCLPVSRLKIFVAETVGWMVSGMVILSGGLIGHFIASSFVHPEMRLAPIDAFRVLVNLAALYLAVGGFAFLISACSDRRGRAIGIVFALLLLSFLLNFLAQFQEWAKSIAWLSVMEYYRPAIIIRAGEFPAADVVTLLILTVVFWCSSLLILQRRSICTV